MTQQQRAAITDMLRASPFDPAGDLREQRPLFDKMVAAAPVPPDVVTTPGQLGGVPVIRIDIPGTTTTDGVIMYFHGGFFAIGSAAASVGLASGSHLSTPTLPPQTTPWPRTGLCSTAARTSPASRWPGNPPARPWPW